MGVVNIKKKLILILISAMFITISAVSAENITDTSDINVEDNTIDENSPSAEIIKKETSNSENKTSSSKTASKISIDPQSAKYDTTTTFNAKITDIHGNKISYGTAVFKINGKTIGNTNVNQGQAILIHKLSEMMPKTYTLTVKYGENSNYLESTAATKLTLLKHNSKITVNNASVITKNTVKLTANIIDTDSKTIARSGKVAFKINGKTVGYSTVTNGVASYSYTATKLSAKTYTITATYGGNNLLNSDVSEKSYLYVSAIPTRMSVNAITGNSVSVVLKATVVEKSNSNYIPSGTVVFKINDKTIGNSTIKNGKVSLKYYTTKLTRGTYKITAILKPTSTYASSTASNNLTIKAEDYFTFDEIRTAAIVLRTEFEANNKVSTVYLSKSRIPVSEFLALMIQTTKNLYKGDSSIKVPYKYYNSLSTQSDSMTKGVLNISQIIEIGDRTLAFMKTNGRPPKYTATVLGNIGFYNLAYTYTRVLDVSTSDYIVSTCRVYNWAAIHPSDSKKRTIYITSDVTYNREKDYAFMKKIKSKLESFGYTVKIAGYGPNSHNIIREGTLPDNAAQLSIFSGADAGVIYDVSTRSFMRAKESRLLFFVYYSDTSTDITDKEFLGRAHDDDYSVSSFTGIYSPDIYLRSFGYDYVYSTNVNTIAKSFISYIT